MASLFAGLLLTGLAFLAPARSEQNGLTSSRGAESCRPCHLDIVESFERTAHFNASRPARRDTILGTFAEGQNVLRTHVNGVYFRMERREDGYYQTGYTRGAARTERFDLVIGSGRRGQSYLYWKGHLLFQLPVSYLAATGAWVNSPGYPDGKVHFNRLVPPRCLECHTSYFRVRGELSGRALRPRLRSRDCLPPVPRRRGQPCRDPEPGAPRPRASDRPLLPVSLGDARGSEAPLRISAGRRSRRLPRAGVRWRPCAAGRAWQPGRAPASEPVLRWQPGYVVLDLPQRAPRRTQLD